MLQPQVILTPKSYWRIKRSESHRNWRFAVWRELFQNSVDAGATRIDINLEKTAGKGSWGRNANDEHVIRVNFTDNGRGMDRNVLENVFFSPGESTKRDDNGNVGGFGTARTMLCFSQSRYSIRTGNLVVEGDGSEYTIEEQEKFVKGAEFEIDMSTLEENASNSVQAMRECLDEYLQLSQMPVKVMVNGEEIKRGIKKGPAARKLVTNISGKEVCFGTIHTNRSENSQHRGKIIVRVQGTTMYVEQSDVPFQVIVEIEPSMSRQVLTDNRDSMKWQYNSAMTAFLNELSKDVKSALDQEDKRKHTIVKGGLGDMLQNYLGKLKTADWNPSAEIIQQTSIASPTTALRYMNEEQFEVEGFGGVGSKTMQFFLNHIAKDEKTFLDSWNNQETVKEFINNVKKNGSLALADIDDDFAAFLAAGVSTVANTSGVDMKYADMHDVHIYKEGISATDNHNLYHAVRRWSPESWRKESEEGVGRGIKANMVLAAWTTCCKHAVEYLATIMPHSVPKTGLRFATGFAFVKDEEVWNYRTHALYKKIDDTHVLMVNPLLSDGKSAYDLHEEGGDPNKLMGISDLMAKAIHETAHIMRSYHDEEYASVITRLMTGFMNQDRQKALREEMRVNLDSIRAAYGKGVSRIQALDVKGMEPVIDKDNLPRPAERLKAIASPATTLAIGTLCAPENINATQEGSPALLAYIACIIKKEQDGVLTIDCDKTAELDEALGRIIIQPEIEQDIVEEPVAILIDEPQISVVIEEPLIIELHKPLVDDVKTSVNLSDINLKQPVLSKKENGGIINKNDVSPAQILDVLGRGRFIEPPAPRVSTRPISSEEKISAAIDGGGNVLDMLIRSGGLKGLASKIKSAAGDTASMPLSVPVPEIKLVEDEFDLGEEITPSP